MSNSAGILPETEEIISEMGWTDEVLLAVLRDFVKDKGLGGQFHEYVSEFAKEEREWESGAT